MSCDAAAAYPQRVGLPAACSVLTCHRLRFVLCRCVVLSHLICRFTIAFCLLLRDTDADYEWDRPHEFQTLLEAAIAVLRLALGDFGSRDSFNLSNARPIVTYSACLLFIFFVPIVLLNALIAIMVTSPSALRVSLRTQECHQHVFGCSQHYD